MGPRGTGRSAAAPGVPVLRPRTVGAKGGKRWTPPHRRFPLPPDEARGERGAARGGGADAAADPAERTESDELTEEDAASAAAPPLPPQPGTPPPSSRGAPASPGAPTPGASPGHAAQHQGEPPPRRLLLRSAEQPALEGSYELLAQQHNSHPQWVFEDFRLFRSKGGRWLVAEADRMWSDVGVLCSLRSELPPQQQRWRCFMPEASDCSGSVSGWVHALGTAVSVLQEQQAPPDGPQWSPSRGARNLALVPTAVPSLAVPAPPELLVPQHPCPAPAAAPGAAHDAHVRSAFADLCRRLADSEAERERLAARCAQQERRLAQGQGGSRAHLAAEEREMAAARLQWSAEREGVERERAALREAVLRARKELAATDPASAAAAAAAPPAGEAAQLRAELEASHAARRAAGQECARLRAELAVLRRGLAGAAPGPAAESPAAAQADAVGWREHREAMQRLRGELAAAQRRERRLQRQLGQGGAEESSDGPESPAGAVGVQSEPERRLEDLMHCNAALLEQLRGREAVDARVAAERDAALRARAEAVAELRRERAAAAAREEAARRREAELRSDLALQLMFGSTERPAAPQGGGAAAPRAPAPQQPSQQWRPQAYSGPDDWGGLRLARPAHGAPRGRGPSPAPSARGESSLRPLARGLQ
eukprot:TRINITY_DN12662_c0_g1_i1.p1 TRINITY_DN12662_c0_g1~~TRINITY_DN12662_c0_g1_i1.p1  ORF type:complete len:655 (+),score=193.08 TRINITY_DN12662_c0_g1_i1:62-2026(+)